MIDDNCIHGMRTYQLKPQSHHLNAEIRMLEDKIYWAYGNVAILKGFKSKEEKTSHRQIAKAFELFTPGPWSNPEGKFFEFNLKDESILILGPKKILEPYKDKYMNLVFIEDLTQEQREKLKVPVSLR